ncbi:type I 3-dehydroquinate dehydratase [Desulfomarina sp.]
MARRQSRIRIDVGNTVIGGERPLVCLPLMAELKDQLLQEAEDLISMGPDLLEWRVDAYRDVENTRLCLDVLEELRAVTGTVPLIFTCRTDEEGGLRKIDREKRLELFEAVAASGKVDLIDVELCNGKDFLEAAKKIANANGIFLIFSYHNFTDTPGESFMYSKLLEGQAAGADIVKLAVMPHDTGDVLSLLNVTNRARDKGVDIPVVTMSMGQLGVISRLAGGLFGSDITFAAGRKASAPGQLSFDDLRNGMNLLFF